MSSQSIIFLFAVTFTIRAEKICYINVPIGEWLQNNTGPCTTVKGHFILDETADNFTTEIFSTFRNLRTIEGCLYVKGFNGSNNLSFFGNLENVICKEEKADASGLKNVIYVLGPYLEMMGFNSLKTVEGPGQIILSYEEEQVPYSDPLMRFTLVEGTQCFTKKEMLFLAQHLQFNGKMYQPCEVGDPCFKLEHFHKDGRYTIADIPENCTIFVGVICIVGPYEFIPELFDKFLNLTMVIGQIHVTATLLESMEDIFPNLRKMYPYELPDDIGDICNGFSIPGWTYPLISSLRTDALQIVRVRLNRFMSKMSLPLLESNRALDTSNPSLHFSSIFFDYPSFFPEPTQNPCSHYPQFKLENCGSFINSYPYPGENDSAPPAAAYDFHAWLVTMICTVIGVVLSIRSMILLQFSNVTTCLPYTRYFLIFSILITTLTTLDSFFIYQKLYQIMDGKRSTPQFLSEFYSNNLVHPLAQFVMLILVSSKYTCLVLLILCYVDLIVFYRIQKPRISLVFLAISTVIAIFLCTYLHSQLFITIRGRRPFYSREPRYAVYMPFIMNVEYAAIFNDLVPLTSYIGYYYNDLDFIQTGNKDRRDFSFAPIPLEIHGKTFPNFVDITDSAMLLISMAFYLLAYLSIIQPHNKFTILVLLYVQLSVNRIRNYIYDLLVNDFCLRKDIWLDVDLYEGPHYTCYTKMGRFLYQPPIMEEYLWRIIEKVLAGLPSLTFLVTSVACWTFARYESYLGSALRYRENRKETKATNDYDQADPSDIPATTRVLRGKKKS